MDEDGLLRTTLRAEGLPLLGLLRQTQTKKAVYRRPLGNFWSGRRDSNSRPLAPHASALPGCATPRLKNRDITRFFLIVQKLFDFF